MAAEIIKFETIQRETIKPSTPTPDNLKSYKLSLLDQLAPDMYVPLVLFYPISRSSGLTDIDNLLAERFKYLKITLSQTLTHFYPLAGKLKNNSWVDCNYKYGAQLIHTKVKYPISKILGKPNTEIIKQLLPVSIETKEKEAGSLLLVKVNNFECGGIAIGLSISHKVVDASTLCAFLNHWSISSKCSSSDHPKFNIVSSLFPPLDLFISSMLVPDDIDPVVEFVKDNKCSTRRFVFDASKIVNLQSRVASKTVPNPTLVEAVSSLIWKCAMEASRTNSNSSGCSIRPSVFCQTVDMRKRVVLPCLAAQNIAGNFVSFFTAKIDEIQIDLQELVVKMRRGIEEVIENYKKGYDGDEIQKALVEFGDYIKNENIDNYNCTSWCRFPLYNKANFGWGKPSWVSTSGVTFKNVMQLIDTKDGDGIEAWLTFRDEDMFLFEINDDLRAFALLNPPII